tara:strand:- start:1068 stop:2000 length:933 start_codon:yes stop_codon:yes gene_type:complete
MDITELIDIIKETKPNLKDSSIKQYINSLRNLYSKLNNTKEFPPVNFHYLKNKEDVLGVISPLHITSQRNTLTAVLSVIDDNDLRQFYGQKVRELNKKQSDNYSKNVVSEKTDLKLKTWTTDDIEKCIVKLKITKKFQTSLILSLIYKYLFRNEVASLKLIKKSKYDKLTDEEKLNQNYIVKHYNNMFISRGVYKTADKHGLVLTKIEDKILKSDLLEYIKNMQDDIMFKDDTGKQMTNDLVSTHMTRATTEYIDPVNKDSKLGLGTSSINKIVIESLQLDGVEKLLEISGNRGTSLGTLLHAYYNNYQK